MTPLEPHEKVLVSEDFLETEHGEIACENCHNGNSAATDKAEAHKGFVKHPSIDNVEKSCGECHEDIVATGQDSLHATLSTFTTILKSRSDMAKWDKIDGARKNHCAGCHTSCGGCHVSRPKFAKKGFINGHMFQKNTDPINQCTSCHGSRVGFEYYGTRGQGDVHATKANMDCIPCHQAEEMHAAAPKGLPGRYHLKEIAKCTDCHEGLEHGSVRDHAIHIGKVQCQVCHSQTYVNCFSCHVGKDENGVGYFQNKLEVEELKIGVNYDKRAPGADYNFMLVRHEPTDPNLYDFYVKDAFTNYDATPTWKRASPHNIQRKTWQAANCNNCHGNRDIFLSESDLFDYDKGANARVVVPDSLIPTKRKNVMKIDIPKTNVRTDMVVDAEWLHNNLGKKGMVLIDAQGKAGYAKGHIKGAIALDANSLTQDWESDTPKELVSHEEIAKILGKAGISADDHVVVYAKDAKWAGWFLWVLEYAGVKKVSFLKGGVEAWEHHGYHLTTEVTKRRSTKFAGTEHPEFVADNEFVAENLGNQNFVVVDTRIIPQAIGLAMHGAADRAGRIPGSVMLPLGTFFMDNAALKSPEELLWLLKMNGVTPDKTVVTTCNTAQFAGDVFFIFRYLGFPDVRVHDPSWISWSAMTME